MNLYEQKRKITAYNLALQGKPATPLEDCIAYFTREGLSSEDIRKAITPLLFSLVTEKQSQNESQQETTETKGGELND